MAASDGEHVALVTGATSGIGRATALALADRDWHVVATGRDPDRGDEVAAALAERGRGAFLPADLTEVGEPERLVATIDERYGGLDGLVNNAGTHLLARTPDTSASDWDAVLGVNLRVAFLLCRAAIPAMAATGGGVVVNVASEAGLVAVPGQVAYNVSKAGMVMLTRSIAVDHASDGIRAVSVCPGTTMTPLVRAAIDNAPDPAAHAERLAASRPANRLGTVAEIAAAIAFVMGPDVQFMTGTEMIIDGGFTAA